MKGYVAEENTSYRYPGAGDHIPPGGAKVLLLTIGGICVQGPWAPDGRYLAWAPLPKRNKEKEQCLSTSTSTESSSTSSTPVKS